MRWFTDSRGDMSGTIDDLLAEQLLSGAYDAGVAEPELSAFLRDLGTVAEPSTDQTRMATVLAATAKASRGRPVGVRRVGTAAAAGTLVVAIAGVAAAADGSAPGDPLYSLDRAVEWLGLDDGGVAERIAEFNALVVREDIDRANQVLDSIAEDPAIYETAGGRHLDLNLDNEEGAVPPRQENVAEKKAFIEENKGNETGLDGKDFGQEVSEMAREGTVTPGEDPASAPSSQSAPSGDEKIPPGQLKKQDPVSVPEVPGQDVANPRGGGNSAGPPDHPSPTDG